MTAPDGPVAPDSPAALTPCHQGFMGHAHDIAQALVTAAGMRRAGVRHMSEYARLTSGWCEAHHALLLMAAVDDLANSTHSLGEVANGFEAWAANMLYRRP